MRLVPSFLKKDEQEMADDELPPLPTEAMLPEVPDFSEADREAKIYGDAAVQLHRHREEVANLRIQLAEATLGHNGNHKKIVALELENSQLRTDIQTLQSDLNDLRRYLSLQKQVYDRFNIKAPEKKPRHKKAEVTKPVLENTAAKPFVGPADAGQVVTQIVSGGGLKND